MKKIILNLVKRKAFVLKSHGTSMMPFLQPGDIVHFKKTSFTRCGVNDIIMVKLGGKLLIHRIIYINPGYSGNKPYLITKGDNNRYPDKRVAPLNVIAKVYKIKRNREVFYPDSFYLVQSTLYFKEIVKISGMLDKNKVDFVFLKGLPLHLVYEQDIPSRLYHDCDILIDAKKHDKIRNIFTSFGYQELESSTPRPPMSSNNPAGLSYYKLINGFTVVFDLHFKVVFMMTKLTNLDRLYPDKLIHQLTCEFFHGKKMVTVQNEKLPVLSLHHLVIYLALHLFHHNFSGPFRYDFLDKIIRRKIRRKATFKAIGEIIEKYRLKNFVYPVFLLLGKYYHTPLPAAFPNKIKPQNRFMLDRLNINRFDIFRDEIRIQSGINRFLNVFFLSPNPIYKKITVFADSGVVFYILWSLKKIIMSRINLGLRKKFITIK